MMLRRYHDQGAGEVTKAEDVQPAANAPKDEQPEASLQAEPKDTKKGKTSA